MIMLIILSALLGYVYYRKKKRTATPVVNAKDDPK